MSVNYNSSFDDADSYKKTRINRMFRKKFSHTSDPMSDRHAGKYSRYEKWSRYELDKKAMALGIEGVAHMSKKNLINILADY